MTAVRAPRQLAVSRCPACGGTDLRTVGFPREVAEIALRRRSCAECGRVSILITAWLDTPDVVELVEEILDRHALDLDEAA